MTILRRPDHSRGLFETLLVLDGEPVELGAHLERLDAGLEALFGTAAPADLADLIHARARGMALGRVRIVLAPDGAELRATLAAEHVDPADFFPAAGRGASLVSLPCPGGLGVHKLADRRGLGESGEATVALLLDSGEEVLETARANVFAALDGVLVTPAADSRILPGIARAGAIAAAREGGAGVAERRLGRRDLLAADEVFLTGSVRGVEPAVSLDGEPLGGGGALSRLVGDGLRRRWAHAPAAAAAPAPATAPRPGPPAR
jgi:para-aminobenzoate synthetase/4-amino-4-deoxychorismate lyase